MRKQAQTVEDIEGPWIDPGFDSSLIQRCHTNWSVPLSQLSNEALATFIRQKFAHSIVIPEAQRRVDTGYTDGTELYDEELDVAVKQFSKNQ